MELAGYKLKGVACCNDGCIADLALCLARVCVRCQLLSRLVPFFPCLLQRHIGIDTDGKGFAFASKAVIHAPVLAGAFHQQIHATTVRILFARSAALVWNLFNECGVQCHKSPLCVVSVADLSVSGLTVGKKYRHKYRQNVGMTWYPVTLC